MNKKKTIRLTALLFIEAILIFIGGFFIFHMEDSSAESQKEEEILQELEFIKKQTGRFNKIDALYQDSIHNIMQSEADSLVYAHEHIPDFEITPQIQNANTFGTLSVNPNQDSSRTYVTSTASDGTVYAIDITENAPSDFDVFEIPNSIFPQLFEENDLYFILDEKGTILDYPQNPAMNGKNISKLGIKLSQITLDNGKLLTINGEKYYTLATKDEDLGYIYVGASNEKTFRRDNNFISLLVCASVGLIIFLLIIYVYFSKQEDRLKQELEKTSEIKNRNPWVFGVIALLFITVVTYHLQSLFCFSMFNMVKQTESSILETWTRTNIETFPDQVKMINQANEIISGNIVGLLSSYPELQTNEHLNELTDIYSLGYIKLFDAQTNELATSAITPEEYDTYQDVIKNYYPIYPITPLDKLLDSTEKMKANAQMTMSNPDHTGTYSLMIGFNRIPFHQPLNDLELIDIIVSVSAPGDLETFTVNTDTNRIIYSSWDNYIGVPVERTAIADATLQDKRFETINLDGVNFYSITKAVNNYIIFLMEPSNILFAGRSQIVLATTLFSALCIVILLHLMRRFDVSVLPAPDIEDDTSDKNKILNNLSYWDRFYNWQDKTAEEKVIDVAQNLVNIFVVVILAIIYFRNSLQDNSSLFDFILSGQWQRGINLFSVTAVAITCMIYTFFINIIRFIFNKLMQIVNPKTETVLRLFHSFIVYTSMIGLIFYCLYLFGMDSRSILASAGILGLIISWGSQDLLTDILAGLFIIFEKQFHVNDMIEINGQRGTVSEIGVRTTKIVTIPGDILYISNRNLSKILNKTQTTSNTGIMLYIDFSQNIPEIENMLRKELPKLEKMYPAMISGPTYAGILDFTEKYARLIVSFSSEEQDKFRLTCLLDSELCRIFDEHGFEMGIDAIEFKE